VVLATLFVTELRRTNALWSATLDRLEKPHKVRDQKIDAVFEVASQCDPVKSKEVSDAADADADTKCLLCTDAKTLELRLSFCYIRITRCYVGRDSSVGKATRYGLDGPGIESRWKRDFPHPSRPALGPTQLPIQWVPGISQR
jgi:hypothetical protein